MNHINKELQGYQFQYIITLNEDNIRDEDKSRFVGFNFDECIIAKLNQESPFFKHFF